MTKYSIVFVCAFLVAACSSGEDGGRDTGRDTFRDVVADNGSDAAATCQSPVDCPRPNIGQCAPTCENNKCVYDDTKPSSCDCSDVNECPDQGACLTVSCAGQCLYDFADNGTACENGGKCNDIGACLPPHCFDGIMNQDETDVDCGGADCDECI